MEVAIDNSSKKMWLEAAGFGYLGIFFGVSIIIGVLAGSWADRRFHTTPWLTLTGAILGIATGFRELYRLARRHQRESREHAEAQPPRGSKEGSDS